MKLNITQPALKAHTELACAVGWNVSNELFSCSDDQCVHRWNAKGTPEGKVCALDAYFTDLQWFPISSKKQQGSGTDVFAVACTDGTFKIIGRTGRVEKSVEAHRGACLSVRWSPDGSVIATSGEDGLVKVWSKNGMLRSTMVQADSSVYCLAWGPDSDQLLYCSGAQLGIKSLQSPAKQLLWKAHEGVVLKVDWSPISNLIVSGGEDCKYKVWDTFGRLLFQSRPFDYAITSVAWCPTGDLFAAGSFNTLALCDRMGWAYSKARTDTGSLLGLSWSVDGTQLAGCGSSGAVIFGQLVGRALEDGRVHASLVRERHIAVHDIVAEAKEELDFKDPVVNMSLGHGHLIVTTAAQCHVYATISWNTPHIFDLHDTPHAILQCARSFMLLQPGTGLQIYTYDGRPVCSPKAPGLRPELLSAQLLALSSDTVAVVEGPGSSRVRLFDAAQGKQLGEVYVHGMEVKEIALSQAGTATQRQLLILDRNRDLHLLHVRKRAVTKLASMVDSAMWHDEAPMVAALVDCKLAVWYHPGVVWVDRDLLEQTTFVRADSDFGAGGHVALFFGARCLVRRSDGAQVAASCSPHPLMLHDLVHSGQWDRATRLCRVVQDEGCWAMLAALAMEHQQLDTAEAAFAAIDAIDKLQFVLHAKRVPSEEGRAAELALYRRQPAEAETILLQAGLIYRAIKLDIRLFHWERALELATKHQAHIDTVLWHRRRHLAGAPEVLPQFLEAGEGVEIDEWAIRRRVQEEKAKEAARPGAKRFV